MIFMKRYVGIIYFCLIVIDAVTGGRGVLDHIDYCTDFIVFFIVKCPYSKAAIEGLIFVFRICEMSIPYFEFFSQRRANYCKFSFCTN